MTHQKVSSDEKWGSIEIASESVAIRLLYWKGTAENIKKRISIGKFYTIEKSVTFQIPLKFKT